MLNVLHVGDCGNALTLVLLCVYYISRYGLNSAKCVCLFVGINMVSISQAGQPAFLFCTLALSSFLVVRVLGRK